MCLGSQQWRGREKQVSETHWPATRACLESFSSVTLSLNKWIVPEECLRLPLFSTYLCVVHNCTYMHLYTQEHTNTYSKKNNKLSKLEQDENGKSE